MTVEKGWLIENQKGTLCVGLCDNKLSWMDFSDERAIRFARQDDGLRMRRYLEKVGASVREANVNEHMWCDAPPDTTVVPISESVEDAK